MPATLSVLPEQPDRRAPRSASKTPGPWARRTSAPAQGRGPEQGPGFESQQGLTGPAHPPAPAPRRDGGIICSPASQGNRSTKGAVLQQSAKNNAASPGGEREGRVLPVRPRSTPLIGRWVVKIQRQAPGHHRVARAQGSRVELRTSPRPRQALIEQGRPWPGPPQLQRHRHQKREARVWAASCQKRQSRTRRCNLSTPPNGPGDP